MRTPSIDDVPWQFGEGESEPPTRGISRHFENRANEPNFVVMKSRERTQFHRHSFRANEPNRMA